MSAFHNIPTHSDFEEISLAFQSGLYNHIGSQSCEDCNDPHQEQHVDEVVPSFDFQVATSCFEFSFEISTAVEDNRLDILPSLFEGSLHTARDVCRYLLHIKNCNSVIGDRLFASIVGAIAALLPEGNFLANHLNHCPSMYHVLKLVTQHADLPQDVKVLKIPVCKNGCRSYWKDIGGHDVCPECGTVRWEHCSQECISLEGELECDHKERVSGQSHTLYYDLAMSCHVLLCHIIFQGGLYII